MFPDDRVLIGVINTKRDLGLALHEHWYRIPQEQMPHGVYTEYVAFFLSRSAVAKDQASGIYYYAPKHGIELAYRRDLLPHARRPRDVQRADHIYYKVQLGEAIAKSPPILNPSKRSISFILTTWDRFSQANSIRDLYSEADYFVDRIYHALRDAHIRVDRYWEHEQRDTGYAPQLRLVCERGAVVASPYAVSDDQVFLDPNRSDDEILAQIRAQMIAKGGLVTLPISPNL